MLSREKAGVAWVRAGKEVEVREEQKSRQVTIKPRERMTRAGRAGWRMAGAIENGSRGHGSGDAAKAAELTWLATS